MCETCGCGDTNLVSVEVHDKILATNDRTAAHNRAHLGGAGVFAVNLMGSPGAGKTAALGWNALPNLSFNALAGVALIVRQKGKNLQAQIPFGIFLGIGSIIALLYGERLIAWYISTFIP